MKHQIHKSRIHRSFPAAQYNVLRLLHLLLRLFHRFPIEGDQPLFQQLLHLASGPEAGLTEEPVQTHHAFILHPEKYLLRSVPRISFPQPSGYPSTQISCQPSFPVHSDASTSIVSPFR